MIALVALSLSLSCKKKDNVAVEDPQGNENPAPEPEDVPSAAYTWPEYNPSVSYDFKTEYPNLPMPTNILEDCSTVVGSQSSDWWTFRWGPNKNPLVTTVAVTKMLERLNTDFEYFRDEMGWPPDLRAKNGYRSAVYLYGSGLCTDNAPNTATGGWQGAIYYQGKSWPMILASYYPISAFDPEFTGTDGEYQRGAIVHEGIHALLADLPGVKNAAWFHEGGNVWLQQEADARRSGDYSTIGYLNGTDFIAPFMPIECYSGWLQDGSFGGPSAEGVNMYEGGTQLCTWLSFLGGHQYSTSFPTFLGNTLGDGALPWIWRHAPGRVLEGLASGIGEVQIRRLITEYRAKQSIIDFGKWNAAIRDVIDAVYGTSIAEDWQPSWKNPDPWIATPYAKTTNQSGVLIPEARTLPGWSGANQIPLKVTGDIISLEFQPIGKNMTCQIAYRSTDGKAVYSKYISSGKLTFKLDDMPANGVVIAVITNTDFIYVNDDTRKEKFDYTLRLISGISGAADIMTKWYSPDRPTAVKASATDIRNVASSALSSRVGIDMSKYCSHPEHAIPAQIKSSH